MQANKTVTINGRPYDAVTGLPVTKPKKAAPSPKPARAASQSAAKDVHSAGPQRSKTLNRRAAKKVVGPVAKRPKPGRHMDIARSGQVTKFAAHPQSEKAKAAREAATLHKPAVTHPTVERALKRVAQKAPAKPATTPTTAKEVKQATISAALAQPAPKKAKAPKRTWRWSRRYTIISAVLALLVLGALLTYVNLSNLTVGFAAAQAGIKASYPEYRPDGYRLEQPVTYKDGEVVMRFVSNSGAGDYTITQTRSSWDSSAVLVNIVQKASGDNYITTQERGLTIYSYVNNNNAAWVNGGILYVIDSSAPLSGEQIRRIATSL